MRKSLLAVAAMVFLLSLGGCSPQQMPSTELDMGVQAAFDNSFVAREFTDELLDEMLKQSGVKSYEIELTAGGFITDDPLIYLVAYQYHYNDKNEVYGYKLQQVNSTFTVLEEGSEVGMFIIGDGE